MGCFTLLEIELATICAAGLPWAPLVTGALPFTIGGHIKPLKTHAGLQWHSCKTILAKNTDITNQQTGDIQLSTCGFIHRGSTNSAVSWRVYALWTSLKQECLLERQERADYTSYSSDTETPQSLCISFDSDRPYTCLTNCDSRSSWNIPKVGSWHFATVQSSDFMVRIVVHNTYRKWCCFRKRYCKSTS